MSMCVDMISMNTVYTHCKVRASNLGRFLIWDKAIFQGTLSYILTVYTAHIQHHLRYLHTECLAREDSGNPLADIEVL